MKWDNIKIENLKRLIDEGHRPDEISTQLGVTRKALSLIMSKFGLKIKYKDVVQCVNCGTEFEVYTNSKTKFCSASCSATYNNKNRKLTDDTKKKISESLLNVNSTKPKKEKVVKRCKVCESVMTTKFTQICNSCKDEYYRFYRTACNFEFNVYEYPDRFDLDLIKKYGWYSASNRGNNINGVSRDHMFSVKVGFLNNVSPEILKHPANCKLVTQTDNNIKHSKSTITLDELLDRISKW